MKESHLQEVIDTLFASKMKGSICVEGTVTTVDATAFTCEVQVGKNTFHSVPIEVLTGSQASIIALPAEGSDCLLLFRDNQINRPQLLKIQQADQLLISPGTRTVFNGGSLGGLVKARELQAQSNKDKLILDALLQLINGPPVTEPGNGAPSALQLALKGVLAGLQSGTWDGLENETVQQ